MNNSEQEGRQFMIEIDFRSQSWLAIRKWANDRLDALRRRNDGDLTMEQTIKARGSIAILKDILALETAPEMVADE